MFIEQESTRQTFWKIFNGSVINFLCIHNGTNPLIIAESATTGRAFPTGNDTMMRFFEPNLTLFFTSNFVRFALYGFF
jgi:hypothetical protein